MISRAIVSRWSLAAVAALACACGGGEGGAGQPASGQPETVDVQQQVSVSPDNDVKAAPRKAGLAGVLPSDFPGSLPVYLPASVVDFGKAGGRRFVVLHSPHERAAIEQGWRALLGQRQVQVAARGGSWELRRGNAAVATATFARISGGTEIRIEY